MKVVFISSMLPLGHYSKYIAAGLNQLADVDLTVYADKDPKNLDIRDCGLIKPVWSKSSLYWWQILRELAKDKPDVVHLQHELNMYGGIFTAFLFPFLLLCLRVLRYPIVVTVHAAVFRRQVDKEFIFLFHQDEAWVRPAFLRGFFYYLFKSISLFSDQVIVHTNLKEDILVTDFGMDVSIVNVIPTPVPERDFPCYQKAPYFFYFGYMVRRKGLGYVLDGFSKFIEARPGSDYKLVLAGGVIAGQEEALNEIKGIIKENRLTGKVEIKGFVEESDLEELYGKATAVIIPAKVSMGSSGPLFHAFSYVKCVIASDVGHFQEDIVHLKSGILTANDSWSSAFQFAVDNPVKLSEIEANVAEMIKSRTAFSTAVRHLEVYKTAVRSRSRNAAGVAI